MSVGGYNDAIRRIKGTYDTYKESLSLNSCIAGPVRLVICDSISRYRGSLLRWKLDASKTEIVVSTIHETVVVTCTRMIV